MKLLCLSVLLIIATSFLAPSNLPVQVPATGRGLENRNWELKEIRFLQDNEMQYYQHDDRSRNTMDFDHDYFRFNTGGSGFYHQGDGKEFDLKWNFAKDDSSSIIFYISRFSQNNTLQVTWEKIQFAGNSISYLEHYTHHNGVKSIGYGTRVAAKTAESNQNSVVIGMPQ